MSGYVFGYIASGVCLAASALTNYMAKGRGRVADELKAQPVRSVEQAYAEAKAAGPEGVYLQVAARTAAGSDAEVFRARLSGEEAIVSSTSVVHEYEDREMTTQQTQVWGGSVTLGSSYGSWHRRAKVVDTQTRGKTLYLVGATGAGAGAGDSKLPPAQAVSASVRIPVDSGVELDDLMTEVAAKLLPSPAEAAEPAVAGGPGGSPVVNVINNTSSSDTFRTIGYRHRERIIRRGRPVVALANFYLENPADLQQAGANVDGITQPYLTLRVPNSSSQPFVLSGKPKAQLIRDSEDAAGSLRLASYVLLGVGLSVLGGAAYSHHTSRQA